MVRMLPYITHIKTLFDMNATWDRLVCLGERKHVRFSQQILLILPEYLID